MADMTTKRSAVIASLTATALAGGTLLTALAGGAPAQAAGPDPADFAHPKANAYFPLKPGLVTRLRGTDDGEHFREVVRITHHTKLIQGVRTTVVRDVVHRADGTLAEKTHDWYAADNGGAVWYFGEQTATYRHDGSVESREGSWQAGVDGARAGRIMPADPHPTQAFRQEFHRGDAEDQAWIVQDNATRTVPAGTYDHVVRSLEWSRLEPGVVSVKFYAAGVGIISEHDMSGGNETFELVSAHR